MRLLTICLALIASAAALDLPSDDMDTLKPSGSDLTSPTTTHTLEKKTLGGCRDVGAIARCAAFGKGTNSDCSCNSCDFQSQLKCELWGGSYNTRSCQCTQVSPGMNRRDALNANAKAKKRGVSHLCPAPYMECKIPSGSPISSGILYKKGRYECLDIMSDVESCGGCASEDEGQDCTAIEHVEDVLCAKGKCVVGSCEEGYRPSADRSECVRDTARNLFIQRRK